MESVQFYSALSESALSFIHRCLSHHSALSRTTGLCFTPLCLRLSAVPDRALSTKIATLQKFAKSFGSMETKKQDCILQTVYARQSGYMGKDAQHYDTRLIFSFCSELALNIIDSAIIFANTKLYIYSHSQTTDVFASIHDGTDQSHFSYGQFVYVTKFIRS